MAFAIACVAYAPAVPFDSSTGGPATATVGGLSPNYASLSAAAAAFSAVPGGINRPWTLLVQASLTESSNSGFGNSFGPDGKLTIKPAPGTTPTIDFTNTTAGSTDSFFGHLVIGSSAIGSTPATLANTPSSYGKYEIDGSNSDGGASRDMRLRYGTVFASLASPHNNALRIAGDTDGVVVKNMQFEVYDTDLSSACIGLAGARVESVDLLPDDALITNNSMIADGSGKSGFGVQTTVLGVSPGLAISGLTIVENDITVCQRGIFMNGVGNASILRNNITITNTSTGALSTQGIFHFNSNGASPYAQVYDGNDISMSSSTTINGSGAMGVLIDTGSAGVLGNYTITNNAVAGPFATASFTDSLSRGISLGNVTSSYLVEHNSVFVPACGATGSTNGRLAGIAAPLALTTGTAILRNNIVAMGDPDGLSAGLLFASATGVSSLHNNIRGARVVGRIGVTDYTTVSDWTSLSSVDTGSQSVNPSATSPAWNAALRFAVAPATIATVPSSTALVDIDGNARPATGAFPGAQEPQPPSANDNFASAQSISGASATVSGNTTGASREAGEPSHWSGATSPTLWYSWTAPANLTATFSTCGAANYDTVLAAYTGASVGALSLVSNNDDYCGLRSQITFPASAGTTYSIAVAGYSSGYGSFTLQLTSVPIPDPAPEVEVRFGSSLVGNGAPNAVSFGSVLRNSAGPQRTIRVLNVGTLPLATSGLSVPAGFTISEGLAANIPAASEDTFTIQMGTASTGTYSGLVSFQTNDPSAASYSFGISGIVYEAASNDNFANAATLVGPSGTVGGSTISATRQSGEPTHWGSSSSPSVWYAWTAPSNLLVRFETCPAASYDTVLAAYTGAAVNALSPITSNDDYCGLRSFITFPAAAGTTYYIAVSGYSAYSGTFTLAWSSSAVATGPEIDLLEGSRPIPNHSISGLDFGTLSTGATAPTRTVRVRNLGTTSLTPGTPALPSGFSLVESLNASIAPGGEDSFTIQMSTAVGGSFAGNVSIANNDSDENPYVFGISGAVFSPPSNDDFANAIILPGNSGQATGSNIGATRQSGEPNHAGLFAARSVWYRWTPTISGNCFVDTIGSGFDTLLGIYTGSGVASLTTVGGNDDLGGGDLDSRVVFAAVAGTTYWIAVDGYNSAVGSAVVNYSQTVDTPPPPPGTGSCIVTLLSPPPGTALVVGQVFTFSLSGSCDTVYVIFSAGGGGFGPGTGFVYFPVTISGSTGTYVLTQADLDLIVASLGNTLGAFWYVGTVEGGAVGTVLGGPVGILLPYGYGVPGSSIFVPSTSCIQFAGQSGGNTAVVDAGGCPDMVGLHLPVRVTLTGSPIAIVASGYSKTSIGTPGNVGPEGENYPPAGTNLAYATFGVAGMTARYSSLVGLWNNQSTPFYIGAGGIFAVPPGATHLYLGVHDSVCWSDNSGGFTVVIAGGTILSAADVEDWASY